MQISISVIIPVFNSESTLQKCLDSIVAQGFRDYELILIDNGSSDRSMVIASGYAHQHKQIKLFHHPEGKQGAARNFGIKSAQGQYIAFVDSDDFVAPDYLANLHECIWDGDVDLVVSPFYIKYHQSITKLISPNSHIVSCLKSDLIQNVAVYGKLFKRQLIVQKDIWFAEHVMFEDIAFWCRFLNVAQKINVSNRVDYFYCQHTNGQCTQSPNLNDLYDSLYEAWRELSPECEDNFLTLAVEHVITYLCKMPQASLYQSFSFLRNSILKGQLSFLQKFKSLRTIHAFALYLLINNGYRRFYVFVYSLYRVYHALPLKMVKPLRLFSFYLKIKEYQRNRVQKKAT